MLEAAAAFPTLAGAMAPPRRARATRARPRRGSVERPVNARLVRGTWLLVALPLLLAAFSVGRPQPLPPPTLPLDLRRRDRRAVRPRAGAGVSRPVARLVRRPRRRRVGLRAVRALRLRAAPGRALHGSDPRPRRRRAPEPRHRRARSVGARDRDHCAPRQQRRGPERQRQRVRHRRADRAGARIRVGGRPKRSSRLNRRTRSCSSRPTAVPSVRSAPPTSRRARRTATTRSP